jgi:hypothetical protein
MRERTARRATDRSTGLLAAAVAACACALTSAVAGQGGSARPLRDVLRELARITDTEWAAIERGEAVAKLLDSDSREVAVAGVVRIAASSEPLVARYRDIDHLQRSSLVLGAGRFSTPPVASDLARAPFEDRGLDLRNCRPSDCAVRLSPEDVARFHREVDWARPDWRDRSAAVWRDVLAAHAASYARGGRRALPVFVNKPEPLSVPDELSLLVSEFGFIGAFSPAFLSYMRDFMPPGPAGSEHAIYWSKEDFGVRPILRISHQVIYRPPSDQPPLTIIATSQIYADHYLDAALTVTLAIHATTSGPDDRFYLVSVNRARSRSFTGLLRSFVRSTVQNRSREALRKMLTSTRTFLEQAAPARRDSSR